jgi:hypothetical protein
VFQSGSVLIAEYAVPVDAGFVMSERYRTTGLWRPSGREIGQRTGQVCDAVAFPFGHDTTVSCGCRRW